MMSVMRCLEVSSTRPSHVHVHVSLQHVVDSHLSFHATKNIIDCFKVDNY